MQLRALSLTWHQKRAQLAMLPSDVSEGSCGAAWPSNCRAESGLDLCSRTGTDLTRAYRASSRRARLGDEEVAAPHDHLASKMILRKLDQPWHLGDTLGHIGKAQVLGWNVVADEQTFRALHEMKHNLNA